MAAAAPLLRRCRCQHAGHAAHQHALVPWTHTPAAARRPRRGVARTTAAQPAAAAAAAATATQLRDWFDVDQPLLWKGDEEEALQPHSPASQLPASWKMMLLSDGSVTRHLQLLTGQPVTVECLSMDVLSEQQRHAPPAKALEIPGPLVQRQVLLWPQGGGAGGGQQGCGGAPRPLVYAASWWASASVDRYLADRDLPIWVSLARGHLELFREIQLVELGHSPELEARFGCAGPFWGRQYYFWHGGAPLTLIHEVFSNSLSTWLGPAQHAAGAGKAAGSGSLIFNSSLERYLGRSASSSASSSSSSASSSHRGGGEAAGS